MNCEFLINGTGGVCCTLSAFYYTKQAMDIVTDRCQLHPGVVVVYEIA